jgi:hypothetical protein
MAEAASTVLSTRSVLDGRWVRLVPLAAFPKAAIDDLRVRLGLHPEMVAPGLEGAPVGGSRFGDAAIITDLQTGEMLGVIGNTEIGDYPGVAGLVIYVDEQRVRVGHAMEAYFRYADRIFALGATKIQMEVLEFNTPVHRIMRKIGARPEAVLREHFYIAGRHWDATLYGLGRQDWSALDQRYRPVVERRPAPTSPPQSHTYPATRQEANTVKIDYLVLADAAIVADGKHYLHGAGWETIMAGSFPAFQRHLSAALRLRLGPGPAHRLGVDVLDSAGTSLLTAPTYADITPQGTTSAGHPDGPALCLVFNFDGLHFPAPGAYAVVLSVDGAEMHRTPFRVEGPTPEA